MLNSRFWQPQHMYSTEAATFQRHIITTHSPLPMLPFLGRPAGLGRGRCVWFECILNTLGHLKLAEREETGKGDADGKEEHPQGEDILSIPKPGGQALNRTWPLAMDVKYTRGRWVKPDAFRLSPSKTEGPGPKLQEGALQLPSSGPHARWPAALRPLRLSSSSPNQNTLFF